MEVLLLIWVAQMVANLFGTLKTRIPSRRYHYPQPSESSSELDKMFYPLFIAFKSMRLEQFKEEEVGEIILEAITPR